MFSIPYGVAVDRAVGYGEGSVGNDGGSVGNDEGTVGNDEVGVA